MANEVQQMTVGVTLEMENFQRQLLKLTLELEKIRRVDLGLDVNSINNINKVLQNLSGTINSVAKGSKTNIVDSGKLEKTASEAKKVSAELQAAAKAVKEYHASFENLLNTKYQSQLNANMKQVENAFSRAKKAMADAKLDSKELGLMPTMFSTFDIKQNSAALKEQLASVAKVNSKLQAQITDDTKATTTAKTTAEKQVQQSVQQSAKVQAEAIHQTVTDEKLRQSVVNQTKLLLTELRKIVAALGDASKKSTGEATQSYEQQGKVIADLTAKIGELAKAAVQAEQTKQTAVNQTTKAYESQQKMYEQLQKNMATAPNEAAYNANQQAYRKAYNYQATKDINTPVSEYMTTPYRQAIYNQIQSALQGKEFQKLLALAPTDKRARFDERAERWAKAVDSLTDVMPATVAALKSATWNPYADKEGYFGAAAATYARKPRKEVAAEEANIRAALTNMERDRIDSAAYQKQWDKYVNANETAKYNEAWKKVEQEKVDNAKLVAKSTKDEVRQYERDLAELEKLRKERIKQEAKALAEKEKENAQAQKAYRKAYEDAYYSTGVGAGVRANREGQRSYSNREVEKMLEDMPAHVQRTAAFEKWRAEANKASYEAWDAYEKELNKDYKDYIKALTPDKKTLKKDYANVYTPTADEKKAEKEAANRVMLQNQAEEKAYELATKASEKAARQKQVTLDRLEEAQRKYYDKIKGMQSDFQNFSKQGLIESDRQWKDLERRYNNHVKGMKHIADMANKLDPTWTYADNPDANTRAGRINGMFSSAASWQQFTPEYRLESNRAARQSMLDNWNYFGNDRGFSAQISQLRQLKEAAWLDYKQGGLLGDSAAMERSLKQLSQAKTIEQQLVKYMNEYNSVLGTTETTLGKFTRKLHSHLNWITAGVTLGMLFEVPHQTISSITEIDEAMHNLGTVMQSLEEKKWDESLRKWVHTGKQDIGAVKNEFKELSASAAKYGASNKDILESARLWGRMYKDQATVNVLTAQSAKLAVADNFSVQESTKAVEAAMFQFGIQARNATEALSASNKIIDVYTKLSHNAGVSAQDLARGVERTGAVAHQAGMDFEFLNALIAEGTRATALSGQEIGNMLKTLIGSFRDKKAVAALSELGISITKTGEDGVEKFRSVQDVLLDVAVQAQTTDLDLQKLFKGISGGKFQWSKAAAMFSNYDDLIETWGMAVDSKGFTDTQVMVQMDSISRRLQQLKTDLESLIVGGAMGGLTESIKGIITGLDNIVRFLDRLPSSFYTATGEALKFIAAFASIRTVMGIISTLYKSFTIYLYQVVGAQTKGTVSAQQATTALMGEASAADKAAAANARLGQSVLASAGKFDKLRIGAKAAGSMLSSISVPKLGLQFLAAEVAIQGLSFALDKLKKSSDNSKELQQQAEDQRNLAAARQQELQVLDEQEKFASSLMKAHQQLDAAINDSNTSEEKRAKLIKHRITTEEELAKVVGNAAVEQLRADGWTQESIEKTETAFKTANDNKRESIKALLEARQAEVMDEFKNTEDKIKQYQADKDAYIDGIEKKIEGLSLLQKAEKAYWDWQKSLNDARASRAATGMGSTRSQMKRLEEIMQSDTASEQQKNLAKARYANYEKQLAGLQDEYNDATNGQDWATRNAADAIFDPLIKEQQEKLAKLRGDILAGVNAPTTTVGGNNVPPPSDDNKFQKHIPTISQPNLSLIPQAESAKISAIKADLDALVKNTNEDLNRINQSIEMYGANDYTTEATRDVYLKQAKAYNDAADKLMEVNKSIRADLGAQLDGTAPIKASDIAQYASSAAGIRAAGVAANNYAEHEDWIGNVTSSPNIQCDSWTGDVYANAGIESIGGEATRNGTINSDNFKAAGAFHVLGDGYKPQPGDLISLDRSATSGHYGIVIDENTVRSRDSSHYDGAGNLVGGGVKTWNLQDWIDTFSGQGEIGFGSIAEATGSEAAKFAQQFEVSNRSIEEAYNSAKETQGVWANLSKEERLAWADAHKDEIAEAKNYITLIKTMDSLEKEVADKRAKAAKAEYEAYKSVATNYEKQVAQAKQNVEYRNQQELANLGLGATDVDKARMAQEVARAELAERQRLLDHKDKNGEVMLKKGTEGYKKWVYEIQKAQVALDTSTEKLIEAQYNDSKSQYERIAKARDLAMGDMSDGTNWFNRYGEAHFNALKDAEAEVERLHKKLDSLRNDTATKDKKAIEETQNALTEAMQKAEKVRKEFQKKINDGLYDIAEKLIFEGENIEDIFKNLWKDLGKDALKILMHQDVGEGSFLTQLLGIAKAKDDGNRLKSVQTETGQLSTDLANNASSVEQTQGIINNEQNIAMGTWQRLDQLIYNTAGNNPAATSPTSPYNGVTYFPMTTEGEKKNNFSFNQWDNAIQKSIDSMSYQMSGLTASQRALQEATAKSAQVTTDNTRSLGQTSTILGQVGGLVSNLFGNSTGGRVAGSIFNFLGALPIFGKKANGGWFDNVPKFAKGGNTDGKISGAGTGRSDSILAYLANKGKFVMLSNGEYVINEKSAKALGYETLDQLNHYANGGVLNPTPYVPTLNQKVVDSTLRNYGSGNNGLYRQSGTSIALMEKQNKMMAEQNDMLKNADKQQGGGQIIVLNTHASSDDVMRALQENPRALQAILGRQNRMGFR